MKITVVCDIYGKVNNGSDIVADNLIRYLQSRGHDVRILCSDQAKRWKANYYIVPNMHFGKPLDAYVEKMGISIAKPDKDVIKSALDGADAVHIMMPLPLGLSSIKIAKEMNLPITAGFHMRAENFTLYIRMDQVGLANKLINKYMYDNFYRYCDAIHYPTQFIRDAFESGVNKHTPGYVISNGVHPYVKRRFVPKPDEYKDKIVVLTTGRYAKEKAQDVLIKALHHSKYKDKIQLILGGEGIKEEYYKKLAEGLPVPPLFKFFGRKDIIDVLNYADIYVHPAQIELEGISCIEAIACGKLTIVSDSKLSATKNFAVDDKCIFKSGDDKDLARVLDYWIENEDERKLYEKKYLRSAVAFDQIECMKHMEKMIFTAIETHKSLSLPAYADKNATYHYVGIR